MFAPPSDLTHNKAMRKFVLHVLLLLPILCLGQWSQLGNDLDGQAAGDEFGTFIDVNADGSRIAIGAPRSDVLATDAGQVRIFEWDGSNWNQLGSDINASDSGGVFGQSLSLNAIGNVIVVGAPGFLAGLSAPGYARVFEWDGTNWIQRGNDIIGEGADDSCGGSVSISDDGLIIAVGASSNSGSQNSAGHVRIFEWDGTNYTQLGNDIDGEAAMDASGQSIDLNASGNTIAIGAAGNDDGGTTAGHVRIYEWDGNAWIQKGADIDGDGSFGTSTAMDGSGDTFAAGGFAFSNGALGYAKVYTWDGSSWIQKGSTFSGDSGSDFLGTSMSLSTNGDIIAIGALGYARVFDFDGNGWVQQGSDLLEEAPQDQFGRSISISSNGSIVAAGTPYNNGNGTNSGHVRVFENLSVSNINEYSNTAISYYPNPTAHVVHFTASESIENVTLLNALGQTVLTATANGNTLTLDLSNQATNYYFAKIQTTIGTQILKINKL